MYIPIPMIHLFVRYVYWHLIYLSFLLFLLMETKCFLEKIKRNSCLHRVTKSNSHLYETLHVDPKNLGLHSICKGAATYCCVGVHPGPPIISV